MNPETEIALKKWMEDHCYHFNSYSISGNFISEGFGIDQNGSLYSWYYTERGKRETLHYFSTEKEAVTFAFEQIKSDRNAKSHCIALLKSDQELNDLTAELDQREVSYWMDQIPYGGLNDRRSRVFILGCDIKKVEDLKQKK